MVWHVLERVALIWVISGSIAAVLVGSATRVNLSFLGRPARYPRLTAAAVSFVVWPLIFWRLIWPSRG